MTQRSETIRMCSLGPHRRIPFVLVWIGVCITLLTAAHAVDTAAATVEKPTFRANHIDYFDTESLAYYLQEPDSSSPRHDYDVAVMFYASWDKNSHALAPMYGKIADILKAGTKDSRLILGLYDCELDAQHAKLCNQAGVTHYPTITFLAQSGHTFGGKSPKHAVNFKGNWQYGDAVLDWLNAMSGLSQWHRAGWGKRIRSLLFRNPRDKKPELPVGIPTGVSQQVTTKGAASASGSRGGASSTTTSSASSAATATALAKAEKEAKDYKDLVIRSAQMMDAILFPLTSDTSRNNPSLLMSHEGKNFTDMYGELRASNAWDSTESRQIVLYSCVLEVSLDYCQRVTSEATNEFIKYFEGLPAAEQSQANMTALQKQLSNIVNATEPYCAILEDCIINMTPSEQCRPSKCPFNDKTACRYVTSCLADSMMQEYATALGVDLTSGKAKDTASSAATDERKAKEQAAKSAGNKKSVWGM